MVVVNHSGSGGTKSRIDPIAFCLVRPDGTLLCHQPYEKEGLLIANLELEAATGLLPHRYRASADVARSYGSYRLLTGPDDASSADV